MSISSQISALTTDKTDIADAIENAGGTVNSGDGFDNFADDIATIPTEKPTETFNVTPTTSAQTITPSSGKVFSGGTVRAMPTGALGTVSASKSISGNTATITPSISGGTAGYISETSKSGTAVTVTASEVTSGTLTQKAFAYPHEWDVTNYKEIIINPPETKYVTLTSNGMYNYGTSTGYFPSRVTVIVPTPSGTYQITENGTYDITDYASVQVSVSGGGGGEGHSVSFYGNYQATELAKNFRIIMNGGNFTQQIGLGNRIYSGSQQFTFKGVEKIKLTGYDDSDYWDLGGFSGFSHCSITTGGTTTWLELNTEYDISADCIMNLTLEYCLTGDTLVLMADGSEKRLDEVEAGDMVLSYNDETLELEPDEVIYTDKDMHKSFTEYVLHTFEDGYTVKTVHPHRFYNIERQAFVYMDQWKIGEHTITKDGKAVALLSQETIKETVNHYKITTKKWHNYFANGMLTGSRLTKSIKLKGK